MRRPVSHGSRYRTRLCQMPECSRLNAYDAVFGDPDISRHWVVHTRLAAFNLRFAAVHFQMTNYSLEVKSRWARTTTPCLLTVWCVYPAGECVVRAFQLANNRHFMIVSLSIFACQVMNPSEADFVVGGIRVNTFSTTAWNMLRLWQCKGSKSGRNEVTSKLDVAEFRTRNLCCRMCVQKREASNDTGVAESFVFTQARKIWMLSWHVLWLMWLSPSFPCPSVRILSFPAPNDDASCPPVQAMVAPSQLEHGQDSSCPHLLSDRWPYWPRKHDVQGTFKAKSLHETTTWTSRDIEIISKTRWSEPELGKLLRWPCRDSSGFLNLHGNRTIFSARWLGGLWSIDLFNFAWFIALVSKNWHKLHKHNFLLLTDSHQSTDSIHLASLANDHFKNI